MKTGTAARYQRSTSFLKNQTVNRKLVVVGDGDTGKTSMLFVFSRDEYPETHVPTIMETEVVRVTPAARPGQAGTPPPVELTTWDTAGQEDYDRLRPLAYGKTDVFIVCFNVDNYNSYINVSEKWVPELRHFCPRAPILVVATKSDLRYDPKTHKELAARGLAPVSTMEGQALAQKVQARAYLECTCEEKESISNVFKTAATVALYNGSPNKKPGPCTLL